MSMNSSLQRDETGLRARFHLERDEENSIAVFCLHPAQNRYTLLLKMLWRRYVTDLLSAAN